jgi:hippurate hydrolase
MGCRGEFRLREGYPAVVNDPRATDYAARVARDAFGDAAVLTVPPSMGGEDFAYIAQRVPACFLRIGMQPPGAPPGTPPWPEGHSPLFDFNDAAFPAGVKLLCLLALRAEEIA